MKETKISLPRFGYKVIQRTTDIDRDGAASYLTKRRQKKITKAVLGEQVVTVEQTVIRCPRCGKETPAYPKFLDFRTDDELRVLSYREIEQWSDRQLRMFEKRSPELQFCNPTLPEKHFFCPICKTASKKSNGEFLRVRIQNERKKIRVLLLLDVIDLLSIPWISSLQIKGEDVFESITFNLKNHRIYLTIENANGVRYATRDITSTPIVEIADDPAVNAFLLYKPISRTVKRCFKENNYGEFPYYVGDWNLSCCSLMIKMFGKGPLAYKITIYYKCLKIEMTILGDDIVSAKVSFVNGK